jgi:beta-glucanase (GH16 family)
MADTSPPRGYTMSQLVFSDYFAGDKLDTSTWNTFITSRAANGSAWNAAGLPEGGSAEDAPNGNAADFYDPSHVQQSNGLSLVLAPSAVARGFRYASAVVSTYGKYEITGGYLQFLVKMPDMAHGGWPAIWLMPGSKATDGDNGEIDVFEGGFLPGNRGLPASTPPNQVVVSNYHSPSSGVAHASYNAGVDLTAAYHVYGVEYVAGISIKTYFDGHLVGSFTEDVAAGPYHIIMNNSHASASTADWHTTGSTTASVMSIRAVEHYL